MAIPRKTEQRLTRCGPGEGVSTTSSRGQPESKFLSAIGGAAATIASRPVGFNRRVRDVGAAALFRLFDADRALAAARRRGARRVATAWIRGLGDVASILNEFVRYVGERLPGAEVTLLVRPGLEDACRWIDGVHRVAPVGEWSRELTLHSPWGLAFPPPWEIRRAARRLGIEIDAVIPYPLGMWYDREPERRRPFLRASAAERRFGRDFVDAAFPERPRFLITLNAHIGTGAFYDFDREWGIDRFATLAGLILAEVPESRLILVDAEQMPGLPADPRIVDARGRLTVSQSVAVIAASDLFVGLDAAAANLVYFLDDVSLDLVVLLLPSRTSFFMPLRRPPASPGVRLTPIVAGGEDLWTITPEMVLKAVRTIYESRRPRCRA